MWILLIAFAVTCGLLGESFEIARFLSSGVEAPGAGLRLTLVVAYAALAASALVLATLLVSQRERRLKLASAAFAVAVLVPWVNFEYLPAAGSAASIVGSAAALVVACGLGWLMASMPRLSSTAIVLSAVFLNLWPTASDETVSTSGTGSAGNRPNVVVILIDTLRADHLGIYGYERPTSPRIDAMAKQSVVFDRAIAQATWTKPSVASLFTGKFVHGHGVIRSRDALGADLPTLATVLNGAGYRTAGFSGNPWITPEFRFSRGFEEFEAGRAMGPQLTNLYRTVRRVERLLKRLGAGLPLSKTIFRWAGRTNMGNAERDHVLTTSVLEWFEDVDQERPFFLYVHLIGPHDPYDPPQDFADAFARSDAAARHLPPARVQSVFERAEALGETDLERLVDQYDAAIAYSDSLVGRIIDRMERLALLNDTIVVLTSDHGEEFYEHGNWRHGNQLYDEVVRVPMIVRFPDRRSGRRMDPAMSVDLLPTLIGVLDLDESAAAAFDGRRLFPAPETTDQVTFSEHWWFLGGTYVARTVGREQLKLHETNDRGRGRDLAELYDIGADPGELDNILSHRGATEAVGDLRAELHRIGGEADESAGPGVGSLDEQTTERLRRLGYDPDATAN